MDNLELVYSGDVSPEPLSYEDLVALLKAYGKILSFASRQIHGPRAAQLHLSHVRKGSISIGGIVEVLAGVQPVIHALPLASFGVESVGELIKAFLDVLKHLRGTPASKVENVGDGNVTLYNENGKAVVVNGNVYFGCQFFGSDAIQPLRKPFEAGATSMKLKENNRIVANYHSKEIQNIAPIKSEKTELSHEYEAWLTVASAVFEGTAKWRFRSGKSRITAEIIDSSFLKAVADGGISFRTGTEIRARLRTIQTRKRGKISEQHFILKVLERLD